MWSAVWDGKKGIGSVPSWGFGESCAVAAIFVRGNRSGENATGKNSRQKKNVNARRSIAVQGNRREPQVQRKEKIELG